MCRPIGAAPDGGLAAWRYGRQLQQRRLQWFSVIGAAAVTGGVGVVGAPLISAAVPLYAVSLVFNAGSLLHQATWSRRVVARIDASESSTGRAVPLRRAELFRSHIEPHESGMAL